MSHGMRILFVEDHGKSIIGWLDYVVSPQVEADHGEGSEHTPLPQARCSTALTGWCSFVWWQTPYQIEAWFTPAALEAPTGSESVICSTTLTGQ